ncbi:unannotated protein [freshwater metagenome]|uniref:Unannotated protein n=1 Tax=freshwater metagenome TaxID=449393 RepID=A0A6J7TKY4_9ZZZZ
MPNFSQLGVLKVVILIIQAVELIELQILNNIVGLFGNPIDGLGER